MRMFDHSELGNGGALDELTTEFVRRKRVRPL
jgi:hypothetical protein